MFACQTASKICHPNRQSFLPRRPKKKGCLWQPQRCWTPKKYCKKLKSTIKRLTTHSTCRLDLTVIWRCNAKIPLCQIRKSRMAICHLGLMVSRIYYSKGKWLSNLVIQMRRRKKTVNLICSLLATCHSSRITCSECSFNIVTAKASAAKWTIMTNRQTMWLTFDSASFSLI